ncbi:hypothetical protein Q5P01_001863 [Channa striata]|uniref:Bcl-2-like protein 15 n=1 Tax=Channa striata TaxID=64152 RepID=A0AA88NN63_CHASR|nr:hypothetical protein Q5P01_001863 [Channa striata]
MAPTENQVQVQTSEIIKYLFEDEHAVLFRTLDSNVECDGPESFDPVPIADKLRIVADSLTENPQFKAAFTDFKRAAAQEAVELAFSQSVDALCNTHVSQRAEVAPEMQIITASVAFGLYIKKSSPDLRNKVQSAMIAFLNRRVGTWIVKQGGWDKVAVAL